VRRRAGAAARPYLSESRFGANVLEAQRYQVAAPARVFGHLVGARDIGYEIDP